MSIQGPFGFIGGLNTKASAFTLPKDSMSDAQNINIVYGDIQKRKGSAKINTSAIAGTPAVTGLADWQTVAGQRSLIVVAGTSIFKTNDLGATLSDITGAVSITSGQNNQSTFASLNNILVRCGGTTPDAPIKWTGTGNAAALGGSPPSGNICCTANNFMFISGIAATPSRVQYSNVIDPETWTGTNYVEFRKDDGDIVTGLAPFNQNLVIFKRRSIGILYTMTNTVSGSTVLGPLTQVRDGVGCVGPLALDRMPDGRIIFLSPNAHVYIFDGSDVQDISDGQPPQSNIQTTLDALPVGRLPYAVVRTYPTRNQVWISVSSGSSSTHNTVLIYNTVLKIWESTYTGIAANVMCASIDTRATPSHPIVMLTGNYGGFVYEQDKGSTNAESTTGVIDGYGTVSVQIGLGERDFLPKSAIVPFESQVSGNLEFGYGFDALSSVTNTVLLSMLQGGYMLDINWVLDLTAFLSGASTLRRIVPVPGTGNSFSMQMRFRDASINDFTVHPVYLSDEILI